MFVLLFTRLALQGIVCYTFLVYCQAVMSLPCVKGGGSRKRDGGIVKNKIIPKNNPSVTFGDRADCQASATLKNASKGDFHPKHFLGLKLIDKTIFCKVSLSKD